MKIFKKNLFRKIRNRADRQTFTNQKINVCFLIVLKISNKLRIINVLLQKSRPGSYQHGIPPLTTAFKLVFKRKSSTFWTFCNVSLSGIWWFTFSGTYPNIFLLFLSTSCLISDIINYYVCMCVNPLGGILPVNDPASQKYKIIAK